MKNVLPASVLHRAKKGFPVPTMSWLRGPLKAFTRETLLAPGSACHNYFDRQVLHELVERHEAGGGRQHEIWTLLVFEHWHRAFVRAPQRAEPMSTFAQIGEPL
jgi:asparagine synthase (glutamine-hydrolysing)